MSHISNYIHTYTRAEALADAVLFDVTAAAQAVGVTIPTAVTAGVQAVLEAANPLQQSPERRLHDLLRCFLAAIRRGGAAQSTLVFSAPLPRTGVTEPCPTFCATIGPGDTAAPVVTIQLAE